jgi:hypothetical protein
MSKHQISFEIEEKCHQNLLIHHLRHMERMPYQELMCWNGTRGLSEGRMWKITNDLTV